MQKKQKTEKNIQKYLDISEKRANFADVLWHIL